MVFAERLCSDRRLMNTSLNLGFNARDAMTGGGLLRISAKNRVLQDSRHGLALIS
jgi:hypothetical protein